LVGYLVDGAQTGGALSVDGVDGGVYWDAGMDRSDTSVACTSSG